MVGFAVVAVPSLLALVSASFQMNLLAKESERLVIEGIRATRDTQSLNEQRYLMDRRARLYQVTGSEDLLASYEELHNSFIALVDRIASFAPDEAARTRPLALRQQAQDIYRALQRYPRESEDLATALSQFNDMADTGSDLVRESSRFVDDGLNELQRDAASVRRTLAWQTGLLIPATIALILAFTFLTARPIRQIDRAISALGEGAFSKPINISGPTDLEALATQLEWLRVRLLEQAREKNKFLRHMSHELKTPLANIREGTELLMDGAVGELQSSQKEVAGILRDNGVALQKLIENLLSFSAWQAKLSDLDLSQFHIRALMLGAVEYQKLAINARGIRIQRTLNDFKLRADQGKLRMAVDNLLANAVKFTPSGGDIYLRTSIQGTDCQIDVADTGPGVPADQRSRIFEAFYQGSTPQGGHVKGTGIGLSVVMECVHAHGGTIDIIEGEFSGAHFRMRLPLEPEPVSA
ncbi:MAG: ATP-binding protein [Gammaproteobacteria bacterium]